MRFKIAKKLILTFWLFNVFLPSVLPFFPSQKESCLVCQSSGHQFCEAEGHECHHADNDVPVQPHCHSVTAEEHAVKIGHKCSQGKVNLVSFLQWDFLPLTPFAWQQAIRIEPSVLNGGLLNDPLFEVLIDHPPQSILL